MKWTCSGKLQRLEYAYLDADYYDDINYNDEVYNQNGDFLFESGKSRDKKSDWKLFAPCLNDTLKDVNPLIGRRRRDRKDYSDSLQKR